MDKVNALILAGDSGKREFGSHISNKSFIDIHGRWMIEYVVDALQDSNMVDKICIIGPTKDLEARLEGKVDYFVEANEDLLNNLQMGLMPFKDEEFVLVATSDIPMIDGDIVSDFIIRSQREEAELCYPIVDKKVNDDKYPGFKRTYVKMKDGIFTGGNLIYLSPAIVGRCTQFARYILDNRKKPWELGRLLGFHFLIMLALGILSIRRVEKRFLKLLNIRACAIISSYPELANDVDKPSDIELVAHYLKNKSIPS